MGLTPGQRLFQPGETANPGGRPKDKGLADLARQYTPEALRRLVEIMRTGKNSDALRAIEILFDRGHGKAIQQVDIRTLSDEEVERRAREYLDKQDRPFWHGFEQKREALALPAHTPETPKTP